MPREVIEVKNVSRIFQKVIKTGSWFKDFLKPQYQPFTAVDNVSFNIREGETFGLLGPNGAGKTTTIKMIVGLMLPTKGAVDIYGKSPDESWEKLGIMLGYSMIYYRMSGYDNLKYFSKLYRVKDFKQKIKKAGKFFGLEDWMNVNVENYSLGMKSKLAMARALIHEPEIIVFDEPTLGLDPNMSRQIRKMIKDMKKTVILTTHNMQEANELCDRIAIINKGKIITIDTPNNLKALIEKNLIVEISLKKDLPKLEKELKGVKYLIHVCRTREGLKAIIDQKSNLKKLLGLLAKYDVEGFDEREPSLEDVFVKLTKKCEE
jgi:ABC-2 type transport system ATP-binding protein